jgi:hypothetical protein
MRKMLTGIDKGIKKKQKMINKAKKAGILELSETIPDAKPKVMVAGKKLT